MSVKRGLTPKRPREASDINGMLRRMIRAYGRRVAATDEDDLAEMVELRAEIEVAIATAVAGQRERGRSWADVARGLGTTRQAAQMRYGKEAS